MKEPFVLEQRVCDLLWERSLQQDGEFFLLNHIWWIHKRMCERRVRSLPCSTIMLDSMQQSEAVILFQGIGPLERDRAVLWVTTNV